MRRTLINKKYEIRNELNNLLSLEECNSGEERISILPEADGTQRNKGQGDCERVQDTVNDIAHIISSNLQPVQHLPEEECKVNEENDEAHCPKSQKIIPEAATSQSQSLVNRSLTTDKLKSVKKQWLQSSIEVHPLLGHTDLVTCVVISGNYIISASRDTSVKVFSLTSYSLLYNYGGHTNTVTAVLDLKDFQILECNAIIISGSLDCSLRMWSLTSGEQVKQLYVFDPITCLVQDSVSSCVFIGSEGGKISLWNVESGVKEYQVIAFDDKITCLFLSEGRLYASCVNGEIRVFEVNGHDLNCVFVSEFLHNQLGDLVYLTHASSIAVHADTIFVGNNASNIKAINWKTGNLLKLPNNIGEFGYTDAVCCSEQGKILMSSAYDIDHGLGYINVRSTHNQDYICTLSSQDVGRITCLACYYSKGECYVVSGGEDLIVWRLPKHRLKDDQLNTKPKYLAVLTRTAVDSDIDSDTDDNLVNESEDSTLLDSRRELLSLPAENTRSSWMSWCNLI